MSISSIMPYFIPVGERNMRNLKTFDVSSTAIAQGSVMLDNSCGTCYTYSTAERKWQKQCEVGIVRNGSLPVPPRRFKKKQQNQLQDNSTTYVECLPQYYTHWLFKGLAKPSLFARFHSYFCFKPMKEHITGVIVCGICLTMCLSLIQTLGRSLGKSML